MKCELQRYLMTNQRVQIIYLDGKDRITQRRLQLHSIDGEVLKAYCYTRCSIRTFVIDRILSVFPDVVRKAV